MELNGREVGIGVEEFSGAHVTTCAAQSAGLVGEADAATGITEAKSECEAATGIAEAKMGIDAAVGDGAAAGDGAATGDGAAACDADATGDGAATGDGGLSFCRDVRLFGLFCSSCCSRDFRKFALPLLVVRAILLLLSLLITYLPFRSEDFGEFWLLIAMGR